MKNISQWGLCLMGHCKKNSEPFQRLHLTSEMLTCLSIWPRKEKHLLHFQGKHFQQTPLLLLTLPFCPNSLSEASKHIVGKAGLPIEDLSHKNKDGRGWASCRQEAEHHGLSILSPEIPDWCIPGQILDPREHSLPGTYIPSITDGLKKLRIQVILIL